MIFQVLPNGKQEYCRAHAKREWINIHSLLRTVSNHCLVSVTPIDFNVQVAPARSRFDLLCLFRNKSGRNLSCQDDHDVAEQRHHQIVTRPLHEAGYGEPREPTAAEKSETSDQG